MCSRQRSGWYQSVVAPVCWSLLLFCASCSTGAPPAPSDVLEREQFKNVLLEAQLIEARMSDDLVVARPSDRVADTLYAEMFRDRGTTKEQFQRSFTFYSADPVQMKGIYEEVITELTRRKDEQAH